MFRVISLFSTIVFLEIPSGGAVGAGAALASMRFKKTANGRTVGGGEGSVIAGYSEIATGGALGDGAGLLDVSRAISVTASDGAVCDGVAVVDHDQTYREASGGALAGGSASATSVYHFAATGGAIVTQQEFSTGFTHRIKVTVPSGKIAEDLNMLLAVRIDATPNSLVTDSSGRTLSHEIRETTDTDTALVFGCSLSSTSDNDFYVYFDHEG